MYKIIKEWVTEEGFIALVVMCKAGQLSGYIGVPKDNPFYGKSFYSSEKIPDEKYLNELGKIEYKTIEIINNIEVYGGLTFAEEGSDDYLKDGYWFFGFDARHSNDSESKEEALKYFTSRDEIKAVNEYFGRNLYRSEGTYKGLTFVTNECNKLSKQLNQI